MSNGSEGEIDPNITPDAQQLFDACSVINLWASRLLPRIVGSAPGAFGVVDAVCRESLFVRRGGAKDDADEREAIDLTPLIHAGRLAKLSISGPFEEALFIRLATRLDDGEAATCAVAVARGLVVVTDERKTLNLLSREFPTIASRTTPMIVKEWTERVQMPVEEIAAVLRDIEQRARFRPGKHDPLMGWWEDIASTA